jgi:hypothetical protein
MWILLLTLRIDAAGSWVRLGVNSRVEDKVDGKALMSISSHTVDRLCSVGNGKDSSGSGNHYDRDRRFCS